ncbi:MAG TPA: cell wall hydrolase [Devosia sp.]|jgi:spore germination cell wall hydrolase CwlJ-like protein|uniref:cell wall hydrolase n=1 Tax=Devosia sp. TaxID=1871048 RepID=UPI002DDC9A4A|nr:cell wall hydrolase [Devosia sp.]HEV2515552.1 cell wall hydrolase [Devosia sp.]
MRVFTHALAFAAAALVLLVTFAPSSAEELVNETVVPAAITQTVALKREQFQTSAQPQLTNALLQAYVDRRQQLDNFEGFDVPAPKAELTEAMLMGYIAKRQNQALDAIESVDISDKPALTSAVLSSYVKADFVPTTKRVKLAEGEKLCLAQAIYHEARGESREGQLAVANVIINRAMSKKYPSTICGVVFQNADKGRYKCQFTFACDGRSDMGRERSAWNRSIKMAEDAFYEFQRGERPGVVPASVLFYHTTAVAPKWSHTFNRVAAIGSHVFYSTN